MSDTKTHKLHQSVIDLSGALKGEIKVAKTGESTVTEGLYEKHLPDGLTPDVVKAVHDYDGRFIAAAADSWGHSVIPVMKKHGDLASASVSIPMHGKNHLDLSLHRERTYPGVNGAAAVTKHGVLEAKYVVGEANASAGQLKQVKLGLNHAALDALAGAKV